MPDDLQVTPTVVVPGHLLEESAARSSGPGGQKVNTTSSKVLLRFDLPSWEPPHEAVARRLKSQARRYLDADGRLLIQRQVHRSQKRNREAARDRLAELIRAALVRPTPRKKTRPSKAAKKRRLEGKRHRSQVKQARSRVRRDD